MIKNQFIQLSKKKLDPLYFLTLASILCYVLFNSYKTFNISILFISGTIYTIFMIFPDRILIYIKLYSSIMALNLLFLFLSLKKNEMILPVMSACLLSLSVFIIITFDYINRIKSLLKRFIKVNDINKELSHTIARLKSSIEQTKNIIVNKDMELLQLSRHASLAEITIGIAHELSQPLTGIKGIAQNMIDDINYAEFENLQAVSELLKISSLVDKSSSIIDHIRNFSRRNIYSMKYIDLNTVILDAIDLIRHQIKKSDIDLIFVLDDNIPKIYGNTISLEQLIVNLILNAKDAIFEKYQIGNELNGQIRISTSFIDSVMRLIIEDNGTGIPEEIIPKIWSPFFTTKQRSHGTGIGLSICGRIIKEHKASFDIKTSSEGTSFIIDFHNYELAK